MLALVVLLLSLYNAWQILRAWGMMREFQLSSTLWLAWAGSASLAIFVAFCLYFPGLAPQWSLLRLPIAIAWFTPAIAMGMAVERKLREKATAHTEHLEKIASSTMYLGIVTIGILIAAYAFALMVTETSRSSVPRP